MATCKELNLFLVGHTISVENPHFLGRTYHFYWETNFPCMKNLREKVNNPHIWASWHEEWPGWLRGRPGAFHLQVRGTAVLWEDTWVGPQPSRVLLDDSWPPEGKHLHDCDATCLQNALLLALCHPGHIPVTSPRGPRAFKKCQREMAATLIKCAVLLIWDIAKNVMSGRRPMCRWGGRLLTCP